MIKNISRKKVDLRSGLNSMGLINYKKNPKVIASEWSVAIPLRLLRRYTPRNYILIDSRFRGGENGMCPYLLNEHIPTTLLYFFLIKEPTLLCSEGQRKLFHNTSLYQHLSSSSEMSGRLIASRVSLFILPFLMSS